MSKRDLIEKIETVYEMIISIGGRIFRILRDEDDNLIIAERSREGSERHYTDTYDMISRYKIDGKPLRDYADAITIVKYTALLDARRPGAPAVLTRDRLWGPAQAASGLKKPVK